MSFQQLIYIYISVQNYLNVTFQKQNAKYQSKSIYKDPHLFSKQNPEVNGWLSRAERVMYKLYHWISNLLVHYAYIT